MLDIIKVNEIDFLFSFENVNEFVVYASDLITVWTKKWSRTDFIDCLKKSNPCLEINESDILTKGILTLQNVKEAKKVEKSMEANGKLILSITRQFNYPFRIKLELQEGSKELFFKTITLPLLKSVNDLSRSQTELCELLRRKDEEINEYKEEGGRIALRHLKTPRFNQDEHLNKHTSLSQHFAFGEFPSSTLEKNVDISSPIIEDFTLQLLAKFKSKLYAIKEKSAEDAPEGTSEAADDVNSDQWLGHKLRFEDKAPVLAKDASTKGDDWFDIYDPRNPINKRKREKTDKKSSK